MSTSAQPAHLVADLETATATGSAWVSTPLTPFAGSVYFGTADIGSVGGLWSTGGTSETTRRLAEFTSPLGDYPYGMTALPGRLVFFAGGELYAYDAASGEVASIAEFSNVVGSWAATPAALFFSADDGVHGIELWRSDGTPTGTGIVTDLAPGAAGSAPYGLVTRGESVFFFTSDLNEATLWRSDGTALGTVRVTALPPGTWPVSFQANTVAAGSLVFFTTSVSGEESRPYQLWRSDGSAAGTFSIADFGADSPGVCPMGCGPYGPSDLSALGQRVVFIANDGVHGREIWVSDGTRAGTSMLRDIAPDGAGVFFRTLAAGPYVFFGATDPEHGTELWRTDGTPAGTTLVADLVEGASSSYPDVQAAIGGRLVFTTPSGIGTEIWQSDGTAAGTRRIAGIDAAYASFFTSLSGALVFVTPDAGGSNLWRSDGTEPGTLRIEQFPTGSGSYPSLLDPLGGRIAFSIPNADAMRPDLWMSDGSEAGTRLVREFELIGGGFTSRQSAEFEGEFYFAASDAGQDMELWASDGSRGGTRLVRDVAPGAISSHPFGMTEALGFLFFAAWNGERLALYSTDGTSEGTRPVSSISPYSEGGGFAAVGGRLFLVADDGVHGAELWRTNGTDAGTALVRDINPGPEGSAAPYLAVLGDAVLFGAWDGASWGIWRSDGTAAGTTRLKTFGYPIGPPTAAGGLVYFSNGEGTELWVSDGTEAGTRRLAAVGATNLVAVGPALFFSGDDSVHGPEPWRSDGTEAGTAMILDVWPGPSGSLAEWSPGPSTAAGERLFFSANDGEHGRELWVSDGTAAGTEMLQDIAPGKASSRPASLVRAGDTVFFTANDGATGVELWAIPAGARTPAPRFLGPAGRPPQPTRVLPARP